MTNHKMLSYLCPTKIFMGIGAYKRLPEILNGEGIERVCLLTDKGVASQNFFSQVENILDVNNINKVIFKDIEPDPLDTTVEKAFEIFKKHKPTAVIALGGGSCIDVGKAVAILATNSGRIQDYEGIDLFTNPPTPIIAIPTTAGTGSEVSGSCVITDARSGLKMSIRSASYNPAKIAILDPLALTSLPKKVAIDSSMDAFIHAFESFLSLNSNPVTDALNLHAIDLISHNIRDFVSDRKNLEAGLQMLCGASLAAMGFSNTGLGNVHCMARFVGAFLHISHGLSNAVCLPNVAEFNHKGNPDKFARVAMAMGEDVFGLSNLWAGEKGVKAIKRLCKDLGIPARLRDLGAKKEHLPEMAKLCFEADYNRWNPRYTTGEDFLSLFEKTY